jgi:hypothetical protein
MVANDQTRASEWPAATVAIAFLGFVAAIFLSVYYRDGVDAALKVWGAIGTVVGVLTGAIPSYFFRRAAQMAQRNANALKRAADETTIERARSFGFRP